MCVFFCSQFSIVRPNLQRYQYITSEHKFQRLMFSGHEDVEWVNPIDAATLAVQYRYIDEFPHQDITSSVIVASFVTAYGRLRLHEMMVQLGINLIYVDTGK